MQTTEEIHSQTSHLQNHKIMHIELLKHSNIRAKAIWKTKP